MATKKTPQGEVTKMPAAKAKPSAAKKPTAKAETKVPAGKKSAEVTRKAIGDRLEFAVGKKGPAGGLVFYDKGSYSDGWRYLEAGPKDQGEGMWDDADEILEVETGSAVGVGKGNTLAMIQEQGTGKYAATLCNNLTIGGFSDWFLPSIEELKLMYTNLKKANLGGFSGATYWSSSRYLDRSDPNDECYDAYVCDFSKGSERTTNMGQYFHVRACRAF
jgi:hypothetical protein